jgi:hypothetical protein
MLGGLVVREYAADKILCFVLVVGGGCFVYLWWLWYTLWECSECGKAPKACRCHAGRSVL